MSILYFVAFLPLAFVAFALVEGMTGVIAEVLGAVSRQVKNWFVV